MKKRKASVSNLNLNSVILLAIVIAVVVTLVWAIEVIVGQNDVLPEVNGEEPAQKKYYLGEVLYDDGVDYYCYHGVLDQWSSLNIVIGHYMRQYATGAGASSSNMYAEASGYNSFYIEGVLFNVIKYDAIEGWIILER